MAEKKISLDLEINKGQADQSVKSIRKELMEAREAARMLSIEYGRNSIEAQKAVEHLAKIEKISDNIRDSVNNIKSNGLDNLITASTGVVRGFQAANGAMALFGKSGEDIEKTMLKLQSVMALADGLEGVKAAAKGFKGLGDTIIKNVVKAFSSLRGAIIATGIGALVVALGLLVQNFEQVKKYVLNLFPGLAKLGGYVEGLINGFTDFIGVTTEAGRAMEDSIAKQQTALEKLNGWLDRNLDKYDKYTAAKFKANQELDAKTLELNKKLNEGLSKQEYDQTLKELTEQRDRAVKKADQERKFAADELNEKKKADADKIEEEKKSKENERVAINLQSKLDLIKDANKKELLEFDAKREAERKAAELVNADLIKFDKATLLLRGDIERRQIEENNKKKLEQEKKFQDDLKKIKDDELSLTEQLTKQYFDKQRLEITNNHIKNKTSDEAFAKELENVKIRELNAKLVAQKDYGIDTTATELEIANATNEINTKSNTKSLEEQKKYEESLQSLKYQAVTAGFELLRALNQESENATESAQKKAFERNKAMAIAETVITTYQAAALAYKNGLQTGDVTQTTSILGAAVAVAQGLAKLVIIKKQTFKGSGGTSPSGGGGGGTGGGGIQAPQTGFTQIRQPQNPNQPQQKQPPVKVFVVQKDIQEATIAADRITAKAVVK